MDTASCDFSVPAVTAFSTPLEVTVLTVPVMSVFANPGATHTAYFTVTSCIAPTSSVVPRGLVVGRDEVCPDGYDTTEITNPVYTTGEEG